MKSRKNPYASKLKRQVTIRMSDNIIEYFKAMAEETGIPYQSLINLYLSECARSEKRPSLEWKASASTVQPADRADNYK